jgi:hypothetical protein
MPQIYENLGDFHHLTPQKNTIITRKKAHLDEMRLFIWMMFRLLSRRNYFTRVFTPLMM